MPIRSNFRETVPGKDLGGRWLGQCISMITNTVLSAWPALCTQVARLNTKLTAFSTEHSKDLIVFKNLETLVDQKLVQRQPFASSNPLQS